MLPALSVWIGANGQVRQQEPEASAGEGEDDAFGEHLEDEAPPAGAERRPDGDFLAAHRRAHQQQVGDVGARDQDHDGDGREERQQRRPDARDDAFLQADDLRGFVRAVLGILHRQAFGDGLHLGAGLLHGDAWLQPCDDGEKMSAACRVGP